MRSPRLSVALAGLAALLAAPAAVGQTTITGQVVLKKPPARDPVPKEKITDPAFCQKNGEVVYEEYLVGKNGEFKNVVVYLRPDNDDRRSKFPAGLVPKAVPVDRVIDQPCCQFEPRIVAARAGDTLKVKNSAAVNHNFNGSDPININNNIPPGQAITIPQPLAAQNAGIPFACNIHPWMKGQIRVFDHPFFAVTDTDGKFEIKGVPAGKYRIVYWHESGNHKGKAGILGDLIDVKGSTMELKPLDFVLAPKN